MQQLRGCSLLGEEPAGIVKVIWANVAVVIRRQTATHNAIPEGESERERERRRERGERAS